MWNRIKFYAVLTLLLALAAAALYYRLLAGRGGTVHRTLDPAAVVQQIQPLQELVTVRYRVQKAIGLKEEKVPFGAEQVLLLVQANVLGGVDLATLTPADVRVGADRDVTITLPPPRVLHVFIDDKDTQVWDRSKTWWTPWVAYNPQLEQQARQAALEAVQQTALQMGILSNAQQNAETTLRAVLRASGCPTVRFAPAR
jgi:hypothetical protein